MRDARDAADGEAGVASDVTANVVSKLDLDSKKVALRVVVPELSVTKKMFFGSSLTVAALVASLSESFGEALDPVSGVARSRVARVCALSRQKARGVVRRVHQALTCHANCPRNHKQQPKTLCCFCHVHASPPFFHAHVAQTTKQTPLNRRKIMEWRSPIEALDKLKEQREEQH